MGHDIHPHVGSIGTNLAGLANVPQESNIERNHPIKIPATNLLLRGHLNSPQPYPWPIALLLCPPTILTKVTVYPKTFFTARLCEENGEVYIKSRELSFFSSKQHRHSLTTPSFQGLGAQTPSLAFISFKAPLGVPDLLYPQRERKCQGKRKGCWRTHRTPRE